MVVTIDDFQRVNIMPIAMSMTKQSVKVEMKIGYPRYNIKKGDWGLIVGWAAKEDAPIIQFCSIDCTVPIHPAFYKKIK